MRKKNLPKKSINSKKIFVARFDTVQEVHHLLLLKKKKKLCGECVTGTPAAETLSLHEMAESIKRSWRKAKKGARSFYAYDG